MTAQRPDILPLAKPLRLGLPYHGLVTAGQLTLPDTTTRTYPQPSATDDANEARAILVRGRLPNTKTIDEPNADYRWQDYALLSGKDRHIGGQPLADETTARFHWIYNDEDGNTWRVRYELTKDGSNFDLDIYLVGLFGVFSDKDYSMAERLLGRHEFQSVHPYDGAVVSWNRATTTQSSHSQFGDISMVWAKHNSTIVAAPGYATYHNPGADAIKVTLAGSGALTGTLGDGITVSFVHYGTAYTLMPTTITADYNGLQTQWVAIRPSGAVVEVTYDADTTITDCDYEVIDGKTWCTRSGSGYIEVEFTGGVYYWRNDFAWTETYWVDDPANTTEILSGCEPETVGNYQLASNVDVFEFQWAYCLGDAMTYTIIHTDLGEIAENSTPLSTPVAVDPGNGDFHAAESSCYV